MDIEFPQLTYYDFVGIRCLASHSRYDQVTSQLNNLIENINEKQKETDDVVKTNPPPCFIAYAEGGEEQFVELKMMLETIRSMVGRNSR